MICFVSLSTCHNDISVILTLAPLIPPSKAEVERSFSLKKLICTKLRKSVTTDTLSKCMRICKFQELNYEDYKEINKESLMADYTKSKKCKVVSCLR